MTVIHLSDALVDKARHALGLTRSKNGYRNYYVADDDADWEDAVRRGLAVRRQSPVGGGTVYYVSAEAKFYFLNSGERMNDDVCFPSALPNPPMENSGETGNARAEPAMTGPLPVAGSPTPSTSHR